MEKNGEVAVKIVNLKNDLEDAQDALGEDQKFVAELKKGCATAEKDYESRKAGRAEEAVAVEKIIKMIDDMVVLLQEEQKDDETQKEWCETEFDTSEDKEGELKRKIAGLEASIAEMKE